MCLLPQNQVCKSKPKIWGEDKKSYKKCSLLSQFKVKQALSFTVEILIITPPNNTFKAEILLDKQRRTNL